MAETHSEAVNNDDLFGEGEAGSAVATEAPEEVTGTEEPSGEEVEIAGDEPESEEAQSEEADETPATVEVGEDALRIIAKKGISLDKFNEYLTRYKLTPEQVNANPSLAHLVLDKAAADELIAKNQPKTEEPKKAEAQDPPDLGKHLESLKARISEYTAPEVRSTFVKQLTEAKDAEEQFGILEIAAANLVETIMERRFADVYSGFATRQQREYQERIEAHNAAWEPYAELNPDFPDALKAYEEAAKAEPELVSNRNLTPQQRMKTVALVLGGRKAEAETVAKAAEKGKELGKKQANTEKLGKGLGAGKSNGTMTQKPKGNDDIFGPIDHTSNRLVGFDRG